MVNLACEAEAEAKIHHRSAELYEFAEEIAVTAVLWSIISMRWFREEFARWLEARKSIL